MKKQLIFLIHSFSPVPFGVHGLIGALIRLYAPALSVSPHVHLCFILRVITLIPISYSVAAGAPQSRPQPTLGSVQTRGPRQGSRSERGDRWLRGTQESLNELSLRLDLDLKDAFDRVHQISDSRCGLDHFEPNDQRARAHELSQPLIEGRSCSGDIDWFVFKARRGDRIEVELFSWGSHEPILKLYPPRARRSLLMARPISARPQSYRLTLRASESGRYRLQLQGTGSGHRYTLQVRTR